MADDGIDDRAYGALRETFGSKGWGYKAVPENRGIVSSFQGNDLTIGFHAFVSDGMIRMAAILSFRVPAERMRDFVWSLNAINSDLLFGSFAMNPADGYVTFDYALVYKGAVPSADLIADVVVTMVNTADRFDGSLKGLAEGQSERSSAR